MTPQQLFVGAILVVLFFVGLQAIRRRALEPLGEADGHPRLTLISLALAAYWSLLVFLPLVLGLAAASWSWFLVYVVATAALALAVRLLLRVILQK